MPPLDVDAGVALFVDRAREHRPEVDVGEEALATIRAIAERWAASHWRSSWRPRAPGCSARP